jgi:hypothetical protein
MPRLGDIVRKTYHLWLQEASLPVALRCSTHAGVTGISMLAVIFAQVTALEIGEEMAARARANTPDLPNVTILSAPPFLVQQM